MVEFLAALEKGKEREGAREGKGEGGFIYPNCLGTLAD